MFVVLVYDTEAKRNPKVIRTCRRYLRWVQRSVFQGELSAAQYRRLVAELQLHLDFTYDNIRAYRMPAPNVVDIQCLGPQEGHTENIL